MSWNISFSAADKADAHAQLEKEAVAHGRHLPEAVKASLASAIDALPECEDSHITVSNYGHFHQPEPGQARLSRIPAAEVVP